MICIWDQLPHRGPCSIVGQKYTFLMVTPKHGKFAIIKLRHYFIVMLSTVIYMKIFQKFSLANFLKFNLEIEYLIFEINGRYINSNLCMMKVVQISKTGCGPVM